VLQLRKSVFLDPPFFLPSVRLLKLASSFYQPFIAFIDKTILPSNLTPFSRLIPLQIIRQPPNMHCRSNTLYFTVLTLSSTSAVLGTVPPYGQCGGQTYTGDKTCESGWTCTDFNPYYSQCVQLGPGAGPSGAPSAPPTGSGAPSAVPLPSGGAPLPSTNATAVVPLPTTFATGIATTSVGAVEVSSTPSVVVSESTSAGGAAPSSVAGSGANGADCSVHEAFKAHPNKLYIGVTADQGTLADATNAQVIIDNFGQVTPENR